MKERSRLLPSALTEPLRFKLRDLLLVTLLVAIALAWWRDHREQASRLKLYQRQVAQLQAGGAGRRRLTPLEIEIGMQSARHTLERRRSTTSDRPALPDPLLPPPPPSLDEFLELLEVGSDRSYIEALVAYDVVEPNPEAGDRLLALLDNRRPLIRLRAVQSLGQLQAAPAATAVPALIALLDDPAEGIANEAIGALGRYGQDSKQAIPALTALMNDDNSPAAVFAALAISRIESDHDIGPRLIELLRSPHEPVRIRAASVLYEHADPQLAERALTRAFAAERREPVRTAIIDALNQWRM